MSLKIFVTSLVFGSAVSLLPAATPTVNSFSVDSVLIGESITFRADVADSDGNLSAVVFAVSGPGVSGWQTVSTQNISGAAQSVQYSWKPPRSGVFTARADVVDSTTGSSAQRAFEVFIERRVVAPVSVDSGKNWMYTSGGELVTAKNETSTSVVVQSNASLIFWSSGRIVLKPGFKASAGLTLFWAAVDRDMDGYSDMEELTDTDKDGMFDAWEIDNNLNMNANDAGIDSDGDGATNLAEFQSGRNPRDKSDGKPLPPGFNLVLRNPTGTPSHFGVRFSDWSITSVAGP
jgi:hypothetical protein